MPKKDSLRTSPLLWQRWDKERIEREASKDIRDSIASAAAKKAAEEVEPEFDYAAFFAAKGWRVDQGKIPLDRAVWVKEKGNEGPFVARHEGFGYICEYPGSCKYPRRRVFIKDVVAWLEFEQDGGPVIYW